MPESKPLSIEANFDGLVGPTHHYGGMAFGNVASERNKQSAANPKLAALQGLEKVRWMRQQGVRQAILPPQLRPDFKTLHRLGFTGSEQQVLTRVYRQAPELLSMCSSASSMWTANSATVAPSSDTLNRKLCITPANLIANAHRSMECQSYQRLFEYIFADKNLFQINGALPKVRLFSDEGAANHMRIGLDSDDAIHVLVYGRDEAEPKHTTRYPARQTRQACESIVRANQLDTERCLLLQQNPKAIDAGVFHNDVIALSHDQLLLCHEKAFVEQPKVLSQLSKLSHNQVKIIEITEAELAKDVAVSSYLFNSQIVTGEDGRKMMLLPMECQQQDAVRSLVENRIQPQAELSEVHYMNLKQSMKNGGGPACLRLRMNLTDTELDALQGNLFVNEATLQMLTQVIEQNYPDELTLHALSSWALCQELMNAVEQIYDILQLPSSVLTGANNNPAL